MAAERTVMFQLPSILSGTFACIGGSVAGRSWALSAGTFVIGRNDTCDLQLPNEAGVSKVHAKVSAEGDHFVIVDCESRNGTIVNGVPVQKQSLRDGDEVRICGCVLRFNAHGGHVEVRNPAARAEITDVSPPAPGPPLPAETTPPAPARLEAPPPTYVPPPSPSRGLASWYAFGLVGSLVFGGAATVVVVLSADPAQADRQATTALAPPVVPVPTPVVPVVDVAPAVVPAAVPAVPAVDTAVKVVEPPVVAAAPSVAKVAKEDPTAVAAAEKGLSGNDEPADVSKADKKKKRVASAPTPAAASSPADASPPSDEPEAAKVFRATADGKSETLRTRGGKVRSVDVQDGEMVSKGQTLVSFEEGGDNGDEIATLRDRIASLEGAEDEEARRELKAAKAKLDALQGSTSSPIIAGMAGRLTGFTVSPGSVLKSGETVGRIVEGEPPRRVKITVDRQTKPKRGQEVVLILRRGGEGAGTVLSISGRAVIIDTGELTADEVESVRF